MGAIAAAHAATRHAAEQVLIDGGNAFDAAVAAGFAACAAESWHVSVAGGGLAVVLPAGNLPRAYDFYAARPAGQLNLDDLQLAEFELKLGPATHAVCTGPGAVGIPGFVGGLCTLHKDLGSMPLREVLVPALSLARDGTALTHYGAEYLEALQPLIDDGHLLNLLLNADGGVLAAGSRVVNPALADFLEALRHEGPALFYRGEAGAMLIAALDRGGRFGREVLARYEVEPRRCWKQSAAGHDLFLIPPPACAAAAHLVIQLGATRQRLTQAAFVDNLSRVSILNEILHVAEPRQVERIVLAGPDAPVYQQSGLDLAAREAYRAVLGQARPCAGSGTGIAVVDDAGNAISLTLGNGQGAGCAIAGLGSVANNLLGQDALDCLGLDELQTAGPVPAMQCPLLLRSEAGAVTAVAGGGWCSPVGALTQVVAGLTEYGLPAEEAVYGGRVAWGEGGPWLEGPINEDELEPFLDAHPDTNLVGNLDVRFGAVNLIRHSESAIETVIDPRWSDN